MGKVEDIFKAKRAIDDIKKVCSHYQACRDCPLVSTGVCGDTIPTEWNTFPMFKDDK